MNGYIQALVVNKVNCNSTWDQHTDKYIGNIVENGAVEFEYVLTQSDVDELFVRMLAPKMNHNEWKLSTYCPDTDGYC